MKGIFCEIMLNSCFYSNATIELMLESDIRYNANCNCRLKNVFCSVFLVQSNKLTTGIQVSTYFNLHLLHNLFSERVNVIIQSTNHYGPRNSH